MKGAVAAGHPLTARAGARMLEEGGNAVDACVAAVFAGAVCESFLTSPAAGGFMLVHRARDRSTRLADFFVSSPGLGLKKPARGRDDRDRRRLRRRRRDHPAVPDRPRRRGRPGRRGRPRGRAQGLRAPAVARAARAGDRARPRRRSSSRGRRRTCTRCSTRSSGTATRPDGSTAARPARGSSPATRCACPTWPTRSRRSPSGAPPRSTGASRSRDGRDAREGGGELTMDDLARLPRGLAPPGARAFSGYAVCRTRRRRPAAS